MFRAAASSDEPSFVPVENANGNFNSITLPNKYRPALSDGSETLIRITPDKKYGKLKSPVYYPVSFEELNDPKQKGLAEKNMELPPWLFTYFGFTKSDAYQVKIENSKNLKIESANEVSFEIVRTIPPIPAGRYKTIERDSFTHALQQAFSDFPLCPGQSLMFVDNNIRYEIRVNAVDAITPADVFRMNSNSLINVKINSDCKNLVIREEILNKSLPLDFSFKGIGGHKQKLEQLVQEAFYTHADPEMAKKLGLKHAGGVLLYGPPGTGKTTICRGIGEMFPENKIHIVNGPEIYNKLVGNSEENIRNLFADAERDLKNDPEGNNLHIIIFDEFDAIAGKRGSHADNTGVRDSVVNQLCTFLDGYTKRPNVLVLCTTNRRDLIDEALLRPGRIETCIEIGLPNEEERFEVLQLKTATMRNNDKLSPNVDLREWAKRTKDFSQAELESLVNKAGKYLLRNDFEPTADHKELRKKDRNKIDPSQKVTHEFFEKAFATVTPAFGIDKAQFNFNEDKFAIYDKHIATTLQDFSVAVNDLKASDDDRKLNVLICGQTGTGKTELAKKMAVESGATNIRLIRAYDLLRLTKDNKLNLLADAFHHAQQTELSAVILVGLDDILKSDFDRDALRIALAHLLTDGKEGKNKCMVIATSNDTAELERDGLLERFNEMYETQNVCLRQVEEANVTLKKICDSLAHKYVEPVNKDISININMPIGELRSKVDHFCIHNDRRLNVEAFCHYLQTSRTHKPHRHEQGDVSRIMSLSSPVYTKPEKPSRTPAPEQTASNVKYIT